MAHDISCVGCLFTKKYCVGFGRPAIVSSCSKTCTLGSVAIDTVTFMQPDLSESLILCSTCFSFFFNIPSCKRHLQPCNDIDEKPMQSIACRTAEATTRRAQSKSHAQRGRARKK